MYKFTHFKYFLANPQYINRIISSVETFFCEIVSTWTKEVICNEIASMTQDLFVKENNDVL